MKTYAGSAPSGVEEEADGGAATTSASSSAAVIVAKKTSKLLATKNATTNPPPLPLCRFYFQNHHCLFGLSCRFSHEIPQQGMTRQEILRMIPCPHYARGVCSFGNDCELLHQQKQHDHDDDGGLANKYTNNNKKKEEIIDTTCGICLENVYSTPKKQFGLLSSCSHVFCHECLMTWRCNRSATSEATTNVSSSSLPSLSSQQRRVCPTCREPSDYVIPSTIFPTTPSQKLNIVQQYKHKCSTIQCREFVKTKKMGSCPFGRDCFYAHFNESGVDVKERDKTMEELFQRRNNRRRNNNNNNNNRDSDLDMITEMLMMMALQGQLNGGGGRGSRRGQVVDDDDDDSQEGGFGFDDVMFQLLSMTDNPGEMTLPMHELLESMGAFGDDDNSGPFNRDSDDDDDDDSLDSMPALEDLDDNSMP